MDETFAFKQVAEKSEERSVYVASVASGEAYDKGNRKGFWEVLIFFSIHGIPVVVNSAKSCHN